MKLFRRPSHFPTPLAILSTGPFHGYSGYIFTMILSLFFSEWKSLSLTTNGVNAPSSTILYTWSSHIVCDKHNHRGMSSNEGKTLEQPKPPKARTAYYQCSFSASGLKLRNSLPQDIQNSQSVGSFRKSLHKYLIATPPF